MRKTRRDAVNARSRLLGPAPPSHQLPPAARRARVSARCCDRLPCRAAAGRRWCSARAALCAPAAARRARCWTQSRANLQAAKHVNADRTTAAVLPCKGVTPRGRRQADCLANRQLPSGNRGRHQPASGAALAQRSVHAVAGTQTPRLRDVAAAQGAGRRGVATLRMPGGGGVPRHCQSPRNHALRASPTKGCNAG